MIKHSMLTSKMNTIDHIKTYGPYVLAKALTSEGVDPLGACFSSESQFLQYGILFTGI